MTRRSTSPRVAARLKPFTVDHFRRYARLTVLDNGARCELEDWQLEVSGDLFSGTPEVWLVVPEGNGKTTLLALHALYHGDFTPTASVPIAASTREQAEIMYRQAEGIVLRTPGLRERFKCQEGYRRIKCLRTAGRIQVFAADDKSADGAIPTLALVDELHRHKNLKLYRTWAGKLDKRDGQIATISTAGEPGSEFEETRKAIHDAATEVRTTGCHVRATDGATLIHDFRVPKRAQSEDMDVVAAANPLSAITAEKLARKRKRPTMTKEHWLRVNCNIASRDDPSPITAELWDPLRYDGPFDVSLPTYGWMDLGWTIDTSAVGALVWKAEDCRIIAGVEVIQPPVDESDVVAALLRLQQRFSGMKAIAYDPNAGAQQMVQLLAKGTHPLQTDDNEREQKGLPPLPKGGLKPLVFAEHSQDNAPMALAAGRLDEGIRTKTVRWATEGDHAALRLHAFNAARVNLGGEKWKYDRPADAKGRRRAQYPIDALTGVLMGHSVAYGEQTKKRSKPTFEVIA